MNIHGIKDIIVGDSSFSVTDYAVVGIFLAVVLFNGLYHGVLSLTDRDDFLIGGRVMRSAPIAISTAMLYISALAIIETPADIYYHGIESFMKTIVTVAIVPLSALLFVSMFHNLQLTSIYKYVDHRYDSVVFRCMTSGVFIVHETLLSYAVLMVIGYALDRYYQIPVITSIIGIGAFTAVNTFLGGFKSTVFTQVFYYFWVAIFLLALTVVTASKTGGILPAFELAAKHERLKLFNFQINSFVPHNFLNFVVGYGFIMLMKIITDQSFVQRFSSIETPRDAIKSIFMSIPLYILLSLMCLLIGIFLQAAYAGYDPLILHHIERSQDLMPYFINKTLSFIPGTAGFFTATIVGSAISLYSTSVNSITTCIYQDFICRVGSCKSKSADGSSWCCRIISFSYAASSCVLMFVAWKFSYIEKMFPYVTGPNLLLFSAILYGPLAAVFLMGMFFPFINKYVGQMQKTLNIWGASIGFIGGLICTGYIAVQNIRASSTKPISTLPPIMGDCPDSKGLNGTILGKLIPFHPKNDTFSPEAFTMQKEDFESISYLLLTILGTVITIILSFPVSVLTGGLCLCASRKVPASLMHPALTFCDCCVDSEERHLRPAASGRYVDRIASLHNLYPANNTKLSSSPPSYKYSSLKETCSDK